MLSKLFITGSYAEYWLKARHKKGHGIHSPFVFDLIENVFEDDRHFYAYDDIKAIREDLCTWKEPVKYREVGALSHWAGKKNERLISDITKNSSVTPKYGQLLFRLTNYFKPMNILELGTSVGLSSLYMAAGSPNAKLRTYDINKDLVRIANSNFKSLHLEKALAETALFEEKITKIHKEFDKLDFVFIDGNHRKEATILYFTFLEKYFHNDTIVILDDIHWSKEMDEAWNYIRSLPQVSLSIDIFQFGILFFRKEFLGNKQNYIIKF